MKNFRKHGDYYAGDEIRVRKEFPPSIFEGTLHSIQVTFKFKDQGWGNYKGNVYIGELRNDGSIAGILVSSPTAPHGKSKECKLVYYPEQQGLTYGLCYKVGGGGGHWLSVKEIIVTTFTYRNEELELKESMRKR